MRKLRNSMRENLRKPINAQTTEPAKTKSMKTQYAKTNAKTLSLMRSEVHTEIKPKGFPSGTPLVFLLYCSGGALVISVVVRA